MVERITRYKILSFCRSPYAQVVVTLIILLGFFLSTCRMDHGITPLDSKVEGLVIFKGHVPPSSEEIRVAVAREFPPREFTDLITTDPLPLWESDTVHYEILLPYGTYAAVGVLWKEKHKPWAISDILGIYLVPFTLTPQNPVRRIDLIADFTRVTRGAYIEGRITYVGEWPPETEIVALAAFPIIPQSEWDYLLVGSIDITLPLFVPYYDYRLAVSPDTYRYIAVFWKAKNTPLTAVETLGFYPADPDSPDVPGTVIVAQKDTVRGVDIIADFGKMRLR